MKVITPKLKDTLIHNFFGGIAWGLGITVGVTIIAYILSGVVSAVGGLPFIGKFLANIVSETLKSLN